MIINAPVRGQDCQGSGGFGAPRGKRKHMGVDIACYKYSQVMSVCAGTVTKIGFPYHPNDPQRGHLRYVQVTDNGNLDHRYFYISPTVVVGQEISKGDVLGVTQGLTEIYKGITDHFHYELKDGDMFLNPHSILDEDM